MTCHIANLRHTRHIDRHWTVVALVAVLVISLCIIYDLDVLA